MLLSYWSLKVPQTIAVGTLLPVLAKYPGNSVGYITPVDLYVPEIMVTPNSRVPLVAF